MAVQEVLSKVKSDFFAILIPGSFVMGVIVSGALVFTQTNANIGKMDRFGPFLDTLKSNWVLSFMAFVMIFLVGNLFRSIRVNWVDKITNLLFKRFIKDPWIKSLYEDPFPYRPILERIKTEFLKINLIDDISLPEDKNSLHDIYNYWKMAICIEAPGSFSIIEDLEGRVRIFAGMFWAGIVGIIGSMIISLGFIFNEAARSVWGVYILFMSIISVIIAIAFGLSLKRVRSQEVISVLLAFLYLQRRVKDDEKRKKGKDKAGDKFSSVLASLLKGTGA
jgi:hypothetical protein